MIRRPPISTRTYTLLPYTTLFRSQVHAFTRAAPRPVFGKEGVWRPGWTARQCTKLHDGAESTLTAPQAPGVNRTSGAGRTPQARVQAATPASAAWRSAWYDERTSGPEATWVKPSDMP